MPIFDPPNVTRLLGSIEAGHLVVLCGAGLSIPSPSNLMSALRVARACYDKWHATEVLPAPLRDDIDGLAGHFHAQGTLKSVFISTLVPWDDLVGEPNEGHAAVADFLICGAAHAALSANFDGLIEQWSNRRKVAMRGALDGAEAVQFTRTHPLLKFHGCFHRQPEETLWTQGQLQEPLIQSRVQSCSAWMAINLPAKDLLIVGLWTDWGYLNDVLANAIAVQGFNSVTVVDPATTAALQQKAPALWNKLSGGTVSFTHIQASGADALEELRTEFSKVWAKKFFQLGAPFVAAAGGVYDPTTVQPATWSGEELYSLRRDAEGMPYNQAAERKAPAAEAASAAYAHILLNEAGAARAGSFYQHQGLSIRIVHGGGQNLESVRERYNEPPSVPSADIVICAGADSLGTPGTVISVGQGASIVRPARGADPAGSRFQKRGRSSAYDGYHHERANHPAGSGLRDLAGPRRADHGRVLRGWRCHGLRLRLRRARIAPSILAERGISLTCAPRAAFSGSRGQGLERVFHLSLPEIRQRRGGPRDSAN